MSSRRILRARAALLSPLAFYAQHGCELRGSGDWRSTICPFHADHHPSMRVSAVHGGFWCPVCEARGSMVDFHMAMTGLDYADALAEMGGTP